MNIRVLHVAESFASGVAAAITDYVANTPEIDHHLFYSVRADAPAGEELFSGFVSVHEMERGHFGRIKQLERLDQTLSPDVVHGHSSIGGLYARLARIRARVAYTPHCFGFERTDIPGLVRVALFLVEGMLSVRTDVFVCCSPREHQLARRFAGKSHVLHVPNVPPSGRVRNWENEAERSEFTVVGAGRLGVQKDPGHFAEIAKQFLKFRPNVAFVWIGGGDPMVQSALHRAGVTVTGWLDRDGVQDVLSKGDLYLHTASWEGFPLAILEASHQNVPILVRRVPSTQYFPTSALYSGVIEAGAAITALMDDVSARKALSQTWELFLRDNTDEIQAKRLREVYVRRDRTSRRSS